jgi:hypothetical protein
VFSSNLLKWRNEPLEGSAETLAPYLAGRPFRAAKERVRGTTPQEGFYFQVGLSSASSEEH